MKPAWIPFAFAVAVPVILTACQTTPPSGAHATAQLQPTQGNNASGTVTFEQRGSGVRVIASVQGLTPGREHGFHIHEAGDCSSGDGESAKGHFNPQSKPHGHYSSPNRHDGDMPVLQADRDGRARIDVTLDLISVTAGPDSVVGRGLIVHADPDDYQTQPTGNAGKRIACGVIRPG